MKIAEAVISRSNRDRPADAVLRESLRRSSGLASDQTREISHAVFAYYRWRGWLSNRRPLREQILQATELAARFRESPLSISLESLRANAVPDWIAGEMEIPDEWLRSLQREPNLWLRASAGQVGELAKMLGSAQTQKLPEAILYEGLEDLFRTPEFHAGKFEIQDISSQAVGWICDPKPGETWWDACAGEGGKTLHLSNLMQNKGLIWASDPAAWRLQKLKRRAARAGVFNYRAALWIGGAKLPTKAKFDGVLVDAPCSGVGTWQRNPHARWTTTPGDVRELAALQKELLTRAAAAVKPGGRLIYSVCTLTRSETNEVADAFENQFPEFRPLAVVNPLKPDLPPSTRISIWPQDAGGNGMFVAVWERKAATGQE